MPRDSDEEHQADERLCVSVRHCKRMGGCDGVRTARTDPSANTSTQTPRHRMNSTSLDIYCFTPPLCYKSGRCAPPRGWPEFGNRGSGRASDFGGQGPGSNGLTVPLTPKFTPSSHLSSTRGLRAPGTGPRTRPRECPRVDRSSRCIRRRPRPRRRATVADPASDKSVARQS
jgi:hypothetical protein